MLGRKSCRHLYFFVQCPLPPLPSPEYLQPLSSSQRISSGAHAPVFGVSVRSKILVVLGLIAVVPFSFADSAAPVNCAHLLGWLAGDASAYSLIKTVRDRGSVVTLTARVEAELRSAGASKDLLSELRR